MKSLTVSSQIQLPNNIFISKQNPSRSSTLCLKLKPPCSYVSRLASLSVRCSGLRTRDEASETALCIRKNSCSILRNPIIEVGDRSGNQDGYSSARSMMLNGAIFVGVVLLMVGLDDGKALAFGPEGPLVEEFWDNVRRYALYALTVSTGVLWAGLQPIIELLKNPITAVLIITIIVGTIYILSQVLSLMVGTAEFAYDYGY